MKNEKVGRFAPSPTGRMHLGNVFTALLSWLSVRSAGGRWVLRIEDLDPQRSRREYAEIIEDDLRWLGLDWDEGGLAGAGAHGPYSQSLRGEIYNEYLRRLHSTGLVYACTCRRADILATQAPHQSDGRIIYAGTCRPPVLPAPFEAPAAGVSCSERLYVPGRAICFTDGVFGPQSVCLDTHCGDFVVRRADGAWAYQLAVVVDDALMGVTEVMRGSDLLLSTAQQLYLYDLLGLEAPEFVHVPLLCNSAGVRLSKRDGALGMAELRARCTPEQVIGRLAHLAGLTSDDAPVSARELIPVYSPQRIPPVLQLVAE